MKSPLMLVMVFVLTAYAMCSESLLTEEQNREVNNSSNHIARYRIEFRGEYINRNNELLYGLRIQGEDLYFKKSESVMGYNIIECVPVEIPHNGGIRIGPLKKKLIIEGYGRRYELMLKEGVEIDVGVHNQMTASNSPATDP